MGHSRGGEGVLRHSQISSFAIKVVVPIAPTDFSRWQVNNGVFTNQILSYCDGDVSNIHGLHVYDDARYKMPASGNQAYVTVMGGNHNFYNTVWTPGGGPGASDDWGDSGNVWCGTAPGNGRLSAAQQQAVGQAYMAAYLRTGLGENQFFPWVDHSSGSVPSVSSFALHYAFHGNDTQRRDLNRLQSANDLTTDFLGGASSQTGLSSFSICGGASTCTSLGPLKEPHTGPMSLSTLPTLTQLNLAWSGSGAKWENDIPNGSSQDISSFRFFDFRASVNFTQTANPAGQSQDLSIRFTDVNGSSSSVRVGSVSDALFYPPGGNSSTFVPKIWMNTTRIPLANLSGVDKTRISKVEFVFDQNSAGALLISEAHFYGQSGPPSGPPTPLSVTPSSGSGSSQTFNATYFDPHGGSAITSATLYFSTIVPGISGWSAHQCLLRYDPGPRNLYLVTDDGTSWAGPIVANGGGTLSNSQCTYYASGASATVSGNTLTATFKVVFNTSTFSGAKPVYLEAANATGWSTNFQQQFGSWTIPFQALPSPVSVTPSSGSGSSQQFTATYTDPNGGFDIQQAVFHVMSNVVPGSVSGWSANQCIVRFDPGTNNLFVVVDGGGGWSAPTVAGGGGVVSNSQCMVIGSGSSGVVSGNTLTVTFNILFKGSTFSGTKQLYLTAGNSAGFDTNYQHQFGSWTVPFQPPLPAPVSVTPSSGSGSSQQFTATYTDANGGSDISQTNFYVMRNVVPGTVSGWSQNQCIARFDPGANSLFLVVDAGGSWSAPIPAGGSGSVSNSQCTLFGSGSFAAVSGNTLTVTFNLMFNTGSFAGDKGLYLGAANSVGFSGNFQQQFGTWNVP
jgi:hypothetical protein